MNTGSTNLINTETLGTIKGYRPLKATSRLITI